MRIAVFHNLPAGGAKRALYEHVRHLQARGHLVDAYTTSVADETYLPLSTFGIKVRTYSAPPDSKPAVLPGPIGKVSRYLNAQRDAVLKLERWENLYAVMASEIDREQYDFVYVHNCRVLQSPHLLQCLKTPSLYFCQDSLRYVHEWSLDMRPDYDTVALPWGKVRTKGHILPTTLARVWQEQARRDGAHTRAASRVLVNSFYSREVMLREYGINAQVCYLGVDNVFYRPPDAGTTRERVVVAVGSISKHKRYDFLIDAVATIPENRRPPLHIYGYDLVSTPGTESEYLTQLRAQAKAKTVELAVHRDVTDAAILFAYQRAGVVAFAPHLEPFGFIPLEAMACETPVVGIAEGGVRETIVDGETGRLVERDVAAFGEAIDCILSDPMRAAKWGRQGREHVRKRWTWEQSTDRLEKQINHLLAPESIGR